MLRKLLIILAVPVLLVVVLALLLPLFIDEKQLLEVATEQVREKTGATLEVNGDMSIALLPHPALSLGDVSLQMPEETEPGLRARKLAIGVRLLPLLAKRVDVSRIDLDGVQVNIVTAPAPAPLDTTKLSDAELKAFYQRRREAIRQAGKSAGAAEALAIPLALNVGKLTIADSQVTVGEAGSAKTTTVQIVDLQASDLNLQGRAVPLQAQLKIPGERPMTLVLEGRFTVDKDDQTLGIEKLAATIEGALPQALQLQVSGTAQLQEQIADLALSATTGDAKAEGKLRYASFESPQVDANLHLNKFTPALLALAGPGAAAESGDGTAEAEAGDTPLPLDALRVMDTRARLQIDEVDWDGHKVHNLKTLLRVVDGYAGLPTVTGEVHGGALDMQANINAKASTAMVNAQGSLTNVNIDAALRASGVQPVLSGRATLDWKLHGEGNTSNAITRTLRGPIHLTTENAVLTAVGVEQTLCKAVALVNRERLSNSLPDTSAFQQLQATVNLGQGRARLQPLTAQLADVGLTGEGQMDLLSLDFDATFNARLRQSLAKLDPACRVDERLTSIDWPVQCQGNVSGEPKKWCSLETDNILRDLTEGELKQKAKKKLGNALDKLFGN